MENLKRFFARRWWLAVITIMALIHPLHYLLAYWNTPAGYRFVGGGMVEDFVYYPQMKFWEGHYQNPWAKKEIDSIFYGSPPRIRIDGLCGQAAWGKLYFGQTCQRFPLLFSLPFDGLLCS